MGASGFCLVVLLATAVGSSSHGAQQLRASNTFSPDVMMARRKPYADKAKSEGQASQQAAKALMEEQSRLCAEEIEALNKFDVTEKKSASAEASQQKVDLTGALAARVEGMKAYVSHLQQTMQTMGSHIERVNKIYQIKYRQSQEELRMASQMMITMSSVALEPFNPFNIPIRYGQADPYGPIDNMSLPVALNADSETTATASKKTTTTTTTTTTTSEDATPSNGKNATSSKTEVSKTEVSKSTLFLDVGRSLQRQLNSIKRLDRSLRTLRGEGGLQHARVGATPQCQSAYDDVYKIWTAGHKDYMKAYVEFETERKVIAKFRDYILDLIKKKQERIRKLQETMGKIRATTEEEASDAVTNAVDAVLRDHGKLIAASCAEMKKAYEESYLRKVGVMTKVSQCEGSSLSMPSRQTPPSAAATGMEKAAEAARRAMGGGAGGGMMGQ